MWRSSILAAKVQSACHCLSLSSACFLPPASCRCAVCPLRGLLRGRHAVAAAAVPHLDAAATALHFAAAALPPLLPTRQPTLHRLHTYPVSTQQPTLCQASLGSWAASPARRQKHQDSNQRSRRRLLRGLLRGRYAVAAAAVPHLDAAATALHFAAAALPPLLPTWQPALHCLHTFPVGTQQPTSRGHCTS